MLAEGNAWLQVEADDVSDPNTRDILSYTEEERPSFGLALIRGSTNEWARSQAKSNESRLPGSTSVANANSVDAFILAVSRTKEKMHLVHFGDLALVENAVNFWLTLSVPPFAKSYSLITAGLRYW